MKMQTKRTKGEPGRPKIPAEQRKGNRVVVMLSDHELEIVQAKSAASGLHVSVWIRRVIVSA